MAKQLNIDLNVNANTKQAQVELKKLKVTLDEAINSTIKSSVGTKITEDISKATQAAAKLKLALENATNVKTGNLDLSKFSEELKRSKTSLKEYSTQLLNLGSTGERAFLQLANSIASAEIPLRKTSGLFSNLWTTMKNTARWQLSSTALHAFMGAVQGAYGYAQDLNKSLNNIRIVTNQNVDEMAKFANEANKAAQSLSTTTTAYTDAALIYYQQGLKGDAVKERTEATIKLANVSRQSAEEVSSQMTAIWNNFNTGGKSLEYYADVITALGASTASSSSEIAEGLQKFAAVADTVGLSYERATSALATVVAETRQSADVVGTAFKTIFARIQGLNLGETLDDGVTLNKYSSALKTVGVNILDANQNMKSMDVLLDELGNKWNNISDAEKTALAQTVAGTRQYTQFIAIMENYDKIKSNQTIAEDSEGTLQKQADTYAESWEAANKRVKAAAQGIYQELLDDKFFIGLNNALAGILEGINKLIKKLGGLPGVLGLLGTIGTTVFKDQIALSIDNAVHNLKVFTGVAKTEAKQMQADMIAAINSISGDNVNQVQKAENNFLIESIKLNQELSNKKDKLLTQDYEQLQILTDITKKYGEQAVAATKQAEQAEDKQASSRQKATNIYVDSAVQKQDSSSSVSETEKTMSTARKDAKETLDKIESIIVRAEAGRAAIDTINTAIKGEGISSDTYEQVAMNLTRIENTSKELSPSLTQLKNAMNNHKKATAEVVTAEKNLQTAQKELNTLSKSGKASASELAAAEKKVENAVKKVDAANKKLKKSENEVKTATTKTAKGLQSKEKAMDSAMAHSRKAGATTKEQSAAVREYIKNIQDSVKADNEAVVAGQNYNKSLEETKQKIKDASSTMMTSFGQGVTQTFRGISQLSMGISTLKGVFDTLNNTEMSFFEKVLSITTSLAMAIPSIASGFSSISSGFKTIKEGASTGIKALAEHTTALIADKLALEENKVSEEKKEAVKKKSNLTTLASNLLILAGIGPKNADTVATEGETAANYSLQASMAPVLAITLALTIAIAALIAIAVGLIALFNAISKAYNADANAAKDAETAAENLAEAYNKCKEEYEQLQETISKRNSALEKIKSLTAGTKEWKEAIREANSESTKLIQKYNLIRGKDYKIDANGVIQFNDGVTDRLEDEKSKELGVAEATSIVANQKAKVARTTSDFTDLKRSKEYNTWGHLAATALFGPAGRLATEMWNTDQDRKINTSVERLTTGDLSKAFKLKQLSTEDLKEKLQIDDDNLIRSIGDLAKKINENTEAEDTANDLAAAALVAEDENVQNSKNKEDLVAASGRIFGQQQKNLYNVFETALKSGSSEDKDAVAKKYLEQAGITNKRGYKFDSVDGDGVIKYKYRDENGDEKEGKVLATEAASALSTQTASNDLSRTLQELDTTLNVLKNSNQESDKALASFISKGDLTNTTNSESSSLFKDVISAGGTEKYLAEKFGDQNGNFTDDMAKKFGYDSVQAMVDAFNEKKEQIHEEWNNITIKDTGLKNAEDMSLETAKNIQANFDKIKLGAAGKKGAQEYINGLNDMLEEVDPSKQTEALAELSAVQWDSYDAMDQAAAIMSKYNVIIDTSSDKWTSLAEKMRQATGAIPDFSQSNKDLKDFIKTLQSLENGKTIGKEEYENVIKLAKGWKQYFQVQADGTYKFIGNAEKLKSLQADQFIKNKEELAEWEQLQADFNKVELKDNSGINIDWNTTAKGTTDAAQALINSDNETVDALLKKYDYNKEKLQQIINAANAQGQNSEAQKQLNALYNNIATLQGKNFSQDSEEMQEIYATTATTFEKLEAMKKDISAGAYSKQFQVLSQEALNAATTLEEFDATIDRIEQNENENVTLHFEDQSKALINLASNYKNTANEIEAYNDVIDNLVADSSTSSGFTTESEAALAEATDNLRAAILAGEAADKYSLDADVIEAQASAIKSVNSNLKLTAEQATKIAIANERMNAGVKTLKDNFTDWKKTLQTAEKTSLDYAQAVADTTDAIRDLLAVSDDWQLPKGFLETSEHLDWLTAASNGSEEAINRIGLACAKSSVEALKMDNAIKTAYNDMVNKGKIVGDVLDSDKFNTAKTDVINGISEIQNNLNQLLNGNLSLDDVIDTESFVSSLNTLALTTGMTVDEMNDTLNSIGVQAKVETISVPKEISVPTYDEYTEVQDAGEKVVKEEYLNQETGQIETRDVHKPNYVKRTYTVPGPTYKVQGYEQIAQISTSENPIEPDISSTVYTGVGGTANNGSSNIGGGVSDSSTKSSNKTSAASHTHEVNRYSNEENAVNGLSDAYDRLSKMKDKAFGASKLQIMESEIKKLRQLSDASKNYLDAIVGSGNAEMVAKTLYSGGSVGSLISSGQLGGTIASDYRSLFSGASASGKNVEYTAKDSAGNEWLASTNYNINDMQSMFGSSINFQLDSYGNITNKDSILNELQRLKNNENDNYSNYTDPDAGTTSEHNKRIAYLDEIKERIEQYGTTIEDLSTQTDAYLDYISQIQEKNAEIITTKLNNGITLSNNTLTRLERALKILGDDIYKSTEKMAQYFDTKMNSNRTEYQNQAQLNASAMAEVQEKVKLYQENPLDENAISPAQAAEIMQTIEENYANLYEKAAQDIADMEELYGNTIDKQKEKISELTTQIDFNIQKLDHLQKVFELLGKKTDYKQLGKILDAQAQGAETNYNVQKAKAEEARKLYSEHQAKAAKMSGTELEEYEKTVLAKDRELLQEYEQEEQTAFETWIEKLQAIHDNNINQIYQDFEDNLTGEYGSFSNLDAAMERQKSITEEYLTKTNQLYETNKMLRNLQKDIDKTDSRMAKEKLKAFSDEITAMQNKEKLTKTDLDLAKAKYEVLKAQIALEEAQNAKSTVRLQRDNEGNYGYIYTADQDKISDAEQNLADKENALYNLALSQANDFSQKLEKIGQEYMEARKKLEQERDEGLISEEQYEQSLIELQDYYRDLELRYLDGYNTAAGILDDEAIEGRVEAWGAGFEHILDDRKLFNDESTGAAQDLNSALQAEMQDWNSTRKSLLEEAGLDNKNFENTINDVTSEIKDLGDQITKDGGLIDQFDEMATSTEKLTRDFVAQYEALLNEANGYLEAANQANSYQNELAQLTNQQLQYNAALAAQPSTVTSGNTSGNYNNNSSEKSSSYDSSTSSKIENNKDSSSDKTKNYQFVQYSGGGAAVEVKDTSTGKTFWVDKYTARNWGLVKFKSGGYTGSWDGPDLEENGKLAFLHQKELVLNASDTENLLEAVKFIRQISQSIDLQALSQAQGLSVQAAQFSAGGQTLEQEVTIHAEFPNVSDHNEIEEALSNLVNRAAQFASRY